MASRIPGNYRGWKITHSWEWPVTGKYRAERFGVGMGAGTFDDLKKMIDVKLHEEQAERDKRNKG